MFIPFSFIRQVVASATIAPSSATSSLLLFLDAGNVASYPKSGSVWTDTISSKTFTLYNSPSYNSDYGGYLSFAPASSQYASSATSLSNLTSWTVETWHWYDGNNTGTSPCIVTEQWPNSTGNLNFTLGNGSDSSPYLQNGFFNGSWRLTPTGYTLTTGSWHHIVGTYDTSTIKLYVDNILVQSASYSGTAAAGSGGIVLMRRWDNPPGGYWGGKLGMVKIYTGSLDATQISTNYTNDKNRYYGGSAFFTGTTTSRLITSGSSDASLQFGTSSFTIEWWQNLSSGAASFPRVFEQSGGPMVSIEGSSTSRVFYFWGLGANSFGSITSSLNNTWNHFAVVRSGSSASNLKAYRNGIQIGSALTNSTNFTSANPINIGNRATGNLVTEAFSGSITNFHWLKGVAKYTGSFTPPISPITTIPGSSGLLLLASTSSSLSIDSSGYNRVITASSTSWTGSNPF